MMLLQKSWEKKGTPHTYCRFLFCCSLLDCKTAVDLVIVVDSSGSIGKDDFETVKQMVVNIIRHFSVRRAYARIGIIRYSSYVTPIITPRASQRRGFERLKRRILRMGYMRGLTRTGLALQEAYKMLIESREQVYKSGKIHNHDQVDVCSLLSRGSRKAHKISCQSHVYLVDPNMQLPRLTVEREFPFRRTYRALFPFVYRPPTS